MTSVYNLCKLLIARGLINGLTDKMDAYLANDRLTVEEYNSLTAMLEGKDEQ